MAYFTEEEEIQILKCNTCEEHTTSDGFCKCKAYGKLRKEMKKCPKGKW